MQWRERPVLLIGEGARGGDIDSLMAMGVPVLTSWQAADLVDNEHTNYFGRPGVYGQRCANKVLQHADQVIAIGCRLSVWTIGHAGLRPEQELWMFDVDGAEIARHPSAKLLMEWGAGAAVDISSWIEHCRRWRDLYPWLDWSHTRESAYINSYEFCHRLEKYLSPEEVIVTDMGMALCGAHQVMKLRPPQRLMTSGGLGEMGVGLPAAIGASFARGKGRVLCLHSDGGMMMNLQELQTIVHHKLPVKIVVFANDGYAMLKSTQKNLGYQYAGVDRASGVSCPRYTQIAYAFGIEAAPVHTWADFERAMPQFFQSSGPSLLEVFIDPEQPFTPKLQPIVENGVIRSPAFEELSP